MAKGTSALLGPALMPEHDAITVRGATIHNLKGIDCRFPHNRLTVVTGVSGSGKSSLAFETVYAEGQRRYLQTFSSYARQFLEQLKRPPVDAIRGLLPSAALPQHNSITQPRSTVGTVTELSDYLALLFSSIGIVTCSACDTVVRPDTPISVSSALCDKLHGQRVVITSPVTIDPANPEQHIAQLIGSGYARLLMNGSVHRFDDEPPPEIGPTPSVVIDRLTIDQPSTRLHDSIEAAFRLGDGRLVVVPKDGGDPLTFSSDWRCNGCGVTFIEPTPPLFSFNTPLGACAGCSGFGRAMGIDRDKVVSNPRRSIAAGAIGPFQTERGRTHRLALTELCRRHDIPIDRPWSRLSDGQRDIVFEGDAIYGGLMAFFRVLERDRSKPQSASLLARYRSYTRCGACGGTRLSADARAVRFRGHHVGQVSDRTIGELLDLIRGAQLTDDERARAGVVPDEIRRRLLTLESIGLRYLSLSRMTRTLSAGEYQRIQLAGCLNRGLVDTCYVLDEPTAGLHARDSGRLLAALHALRDQGSTVIVVEHDTEIICGADHVIELGPRGGEQGGRLLFEGTVDELKAADTPTALALAATPPVRPPRAPDNRRLSVIGASVHNLRDIEVDFPVGRLSAVTGVSGSGKTSLVFGVLQPGLRSILERSRPVDPLLCEAIEGSRWVGSVIAMDRALSAPGMRSTVLTHTGVLEPIRKLLASTPAAKERGLTPFHFSTNVRGGRCDACEGLGVRRVDMHFMADVEVVCDACGGARFKPHVLEVRIAGKNIADLHRQTVREAIALFADHPSTVARLEPLEEVGLGYLGLGQPVRTLSGGEAQRLRIAEHLVSGAPSEGHEVDGVGSGRRTLFLFDEPSLGLHASDVAVLISLFQRLCGDGHTVIAVEHNLDIIAAADWVVDLGPEAGDEGGRVVVAGPPGAVVDCASSHTGRALRQRQAGDG